MNCESNINWLLVVFQVGLPSLMALLVPFIAFSRFSKRFKEFDNSLAADLKSYENALNRRLEEYKIQLSEKTALVGIRLQRLEEVHKSVSQFMYTIANSAQEATLMAANGYEMAEYVEKIHGTLLPPMSAISTQLRLFLPETQPHFATLSQKLEGYIDACSNYISVGGDCFEGVSRFQRELMDICNSILEKIEHASTELTKC